MTSFIELSLSTSLRNMWMEVTFNPYSPNGYIFYAGNSTAEPDYLSISMTGGRLEVRYDLGSGSASVLSDPLELNIWHTMFMTRRGQEMSLRVDSNHYEAVLSPGSLTELNVQSTVGIGGLSSYGILSSQADETLPGLTGCIRSLVVSLLAINSNVSWPVCDKFFHFLKIIQ